MISSLSSIAEDHESLLRRQNFLVAVQLGWVDRPYWFWQEYGPLVTVPHQDFSALVGEGGSGW